MFSPGSAYFLYVSGPFFLAPAQATHVLNMVAVDPLNGRTQATHEGLSELALARQRCVKPVPQQDPNALDGIQILRAFGVIL